jgi:hypothetical protein
MTVRVIWGRTTECSVARVAVWDVFKAHAIRYQQRELHRDRQVR